MIYDILKTIVIVIVTIPILSWTKVLSTGSSVKWSQYFIFPIVGLLGGMVSRYIVLESAIGILVPYYFILRAYLNKNLYVGFIEQYGGAILYFIAYYYSYMGT